MAALGARLVLNGRNEKRLATSLAELQGRGAEAIAVTGDISKASDCEALINETIAHFGRLDVLINNAGISMEGKVEELDPEVVKKVMDVNFLGSVYPTQKALPHLRKTKGSIIFIGSAAGIRGLPNYAAYSASKMALTALAESLKIELHGSGVHIGLAYVGFTENDPDKTIYDKDGNIVPQPRRDFIKAEPPENVARRVINMIEQQRFKQVFTPLGKLNAVMNRWFPSLVERILRNNYQKRQAEEES